MNDPRVRARLWLPGLLVAAGAAVATAHGLYEVARAAGAPTLIAALYPVICDGLALVAYGATGRLHSSGRSYAWTIVVLAAALSGLAQAAYLADGVHTAPTWLRFGVGAWPALAAALTAHLLHLLTTSYDRPYDRTEGRTEDAAELYERPYGRAQDGAEPYGAEQLAVRPNGLHPHDEPAGDRVRPEYLLRAPYAGSYDHPSSRTDEAVEPYDGEPDAANDPEADATSTGELGRLLNGHTSPYDPPYGRTNHAPAPYGGEQAAVRPDDLRPDAASAGERARAAAQRHHDRNDALPTVSELMNLADVGRGTAGAVLKQLRAERPALHVIPAVPADPRTDR